MWAFLQDNFHCRHDQKATRTTVPFIVLSRFSITRLEGKSLFNEAIYPCIRQTMHTFLVLDSCGREFSLPQRPRAGTSCLWWRLCMRASDYTLAKLIKKNIRWIFFWDPFVMCCLCNVLNYFCTVTSFLTLKNTRVYFNKRSKSTPAGSKQEMFSKISDKIFQSFLRNNS